MGQVIKLISKQQEQIELTLFDKIKANRLEVYDENDTTLRDYIDSEGFKQVRYRDEYAGGAWLNPTGGAAPDLVTVVIGGVSTQKYSFDGNNTEERLANSFEIAHDIPIDLVNDLTLKLEWHVHARPSSNNAGVVKWFFDWSYTPPPVEGVAQSPIAMTTLTCLQTIAANSQYKHVLCGTEMPVPLGGYQIGGIISFNLRRTPTDSQDTYGYDILLIKTALHVPTDDRGSRQRYIK